MAGLVREKVDQAIGAMQELGVDAWLTLVSETSAMRDPVLPLIFGEATLTWTSALILTAAGDSVAIVGRFDADIAEHIGAYRRVIPYDRSIREPFLAELARIDPRQLAINYSISDVYADGLPHGMYLLLQDYLKGTPYAARLISSENIVSAIRGRKTTDEVARVKAAVEAAESIIAMAFQRARPGMSELQIAHFMQSQARRAHLGLAWSAEDCPIVNAGAASPTGHVSPTRLRLSPGSLLHIDFGVRKAGYCSDLQRMAFCLQPGELQPPETVERGFVTVVQAVRRTVQALKPGVLGRDVDGIARSTLTDAGYPEYMHALGHQLGREAHDGGGLLGPTWERYSDLPLRPVEAGQIYTVEPSLHVPDFGTIGIEEDVLVTDVGAVYLSEPQTSLVLIQ